MVDDIAFAPEVTLTKTLPLLGYGKRFSFVKPFFIKSIEICAIHGYKDGNSA